VIVSSASSGDTVPSSPRKGKRAESSGRVTSPAKSPPLAKGLKGTKKTVAKDTAPRGKRAVKAKSDKIRKVTHKAKK
jgi:hypothetical protein